MSKEWEKFEKEYKGMKARIKTYSAEEGSAYRTRINSANTNCGEGERHLSDSMVKARKNGVTGTTLSDFMKDPGFKEAYGLLHSALNDMAQELADMEKFSKEAQTLHDDLAKLDAAITKDLKSRKDSSASKKDIEALQAQIVLDMKSAKEAAGKWAAVEPLKKNRPANFTKTVAGILKLAPEVQEERLEATMLPQLLVDRTLKLNLGKAARLAKEIADGCSEAIDKAADDMGAAATLVKKAAVALKELKELNDDYKKLETDHKKLINDSKDKAKIIKAIETIASAYKASDSKVRGTATTLKKAG